MIYSVTDKHRSLNQAGVPADVPGRARTQRSTEAADPSLCCTLALFLDYTVCSATAGSKVVPRPPRPARPPLTQPDPAALHMHTQSITLHHPSFRRCFCNVIYVTFWVVTTLQLNAQWQLNKAFIRQLPEESNTVTVWNISTSLCLSNPTLPQQLNKLH